MAISLLFIYHIGCIVNVIYATVSNQINRQKEKAVRVFARPFVLIGSILNHVFVLKSIKQP